MTEVCVRVAVRIRPLLPREILHNHKVCLREVPGSSQVILGSDRLFSFDHTFGPAASQDEVYESCVQPLVETLIGGYNATVFCYGQTGSGKTHTLKGGDMDEEGGLIDRVAQDVFLFLEEKRASERVEASVKVTYMELYREELRDLLDVHPNQKELHIREDKKGNTVVVGAKEIAVTSAEELLSVVETGNALRHTSATGMNEQSSRSHIILTLQLTQSGPDLAVSSKLCLVDLAGAERVAKTGNTGTQLKESININTGLLALGNVIRALSDPGRNRRGSGCSGAHIPYRDAKITRLLRDALGGNAHTLIVACVSPSHHSVAETLSVLQFASKARHIQNRPAAGSTHSESDSSLTAWDLRDVRISELEFEAQALRQLLKEKQREMAASRGHANGVSLAHLGPPTSEHDQDVIRREASQYHLLAQEAASLLADVSSHDGIELSLRQQVQDWQDRLTSVSHQQPADSKGQSEGGCQPQDPAMIQLREELDHCKEALTIEEKLHEQKDSKLKQLQKEMETLLQEKRVYLQALEEEKKRNSIQTEHLVDQQILITRLRSNHAASTDGSSGVSVDAGASRTSDRRPYSVPLIGHNCRYGPIRRFHSSPLAYSLERVMAAFKTQSNLLFAEIEEKNRVQCVQIEQQKESKVADQRDKEDTPVDRSGFRRSLNRTWTSRQWRLASKEETVGQEQTTGEDHSQHHQEPGTKETHEQESQTKKARLRDSVTQRQIRDLSVNIQMKEELIKELDKTDKEAQAVDKMGTKCVDGGDASVFNRLSVQNQQVQAEALCSLQHMRQQRAQLQASLRQQRHTSGGSTTRHHNGGQWDKDVDYKCNHQEETEEQQGTSWLEEEEDMVLQRRAELQELEEELKRREEVLQRRKACLQQKHSLEMKMLRSSQSHSQDLLQVVDHLGSLEEQEQRCSALGASTAELEEAASGVKNSWDSLHNQPVASQELRTEEEQSLLQLEEAIEALDANLELKNRSIQDRQKALLTSDTSLSQLQNMEPVKLANMARKLEGLPPPEVLRLLARYFNRVVRLREAECRLRLHCKELELRVGEGELSLKELKLATRRLILDADRRRTQQHQRHQSDIQLLLHKLKEGSSGEAQQVVQDRLQHLEKELCFYKSSSRELRKKLKERLHDSSHTPHQPLNAAGSEQAHAQMPEMKKEGQTSTEGERKRTQLAATFARPTVERHEETMTRGTSQSVKQTHPNLSHHRSSAADSRPNRSSEAAESKQRQTQSQGDGAEVQLHPELHPHPEKKDMTPVRLHRRELKQIFPSEQHISARSRSAVSSGEVLQQDSGSPVSRRLTSDGGRGSSFTVIKN